VRSGVTIGGREGGRSGGRRRRRRRWGRERGVDVFVANNLAGIAVVYAVLVVAHEGRMQKQRRIVLLT
jgi:hypothetical protein